MIEPENQEATKDPPPAATPTTPPARDSGGWFGWLLFFALIGGGGYTYYQGWLDKPLALLASQQENNKTADGLATTGTVPAPTSNPPIAPNTATSDSTRGLLTQLEAMQSRMLKMENEVRNLQAISENIADQVVRREGGGLATSTYKLELGLIDLRLRVSGDTKVAITELDELGTRTANDSPYLPLIESNRKRLNGIPPRNDILLLFTEVETGVNDTQEVVQQQLDTFTTSQRDEASLLNTLFSVRKENPALLRELELAKQVAITIPTARAALQQGNSDTYLLALDKLLLAADTLREYRATSHTSTIARALAQLTSIGFPENRLFLGDNATTGQ